MCIITLFFQACCVFYFIFFCQNQTEKKKKVRKKCFHFINFPSNKARRKEKCLQLIYVSFSTSTSIASQVSCIVAFRDRIIFGSFPALGSSDSCREDCNKVQESCCCSKMCYGCRTTTSSYTFLLLKHTLLPSMNPVTCHASYFINTERLFSFPDPTWVVKNSENSKQN